MKFEKYVYIHHIYSVYEIEKKHVYVYINTVYENMRYPVYIAFISDRQNLIIDYLISSFLESGVDRECQNVLLNLAGGKFARGRGVGSFGYLQEYRLIYCFLNFFHLGVTHLQVELIISMKF